MMTAKSLGRIAAGAAVLAAVVSAPVAADAATRHFVLFSNRSGNLYKVCYRANDAAGRQIGSDCDRVAARGKSTFFVPAGTASTWFGVGATTESTPSEFVKPALSAGRDWCFRATGSGAIHEATEQPCTSN